MNGLSEMGLCGSKAQATRRRPVVLVNAYWKTELAKQGGMI
jgi:hypothetical protein